LDIGVLGYIGIVWPKEHSPEVWSVPPVTTYIHLRLHVTVLTWSSSGRLNTRKPKLHLQTSFQGTRLRSSYFFFGAITKLRKATIRFVMYACVSERPSLCPSVRMGQLCSHWTDLKEIRYLSIFRKSVEKIQVSLKYDMNNGHFTWRPIFFVDHITPSSS